MAREQIDASPLSRLLLGDAQAYDRWARDLAAGHWLGDQVFYQAPHPRDGCLSTRSGA
jgi:hypothetical protein